MKCIFNNILIVINYGYNPNQGGFGAAINNPWFGVLENQFADMQQSGWRYAVCECSFNPLYTGQTFDITYL